MVHRIGGMAFFARHKIEGGFVQMHPRKRRWNGGAQLGSFGAGAIWYLLYFGAGERIGLLPKAKRQNGKRLYDAETLASLGVIRLAQSAGFSIHEIRALLHDFPKDAPPAERWQILSRQKLTQIEAQMQALQKMKVLLEGTLNCACEKLEDCAND